MATERSHDTTKGDISMRVRIALAIALLAVALLAGCTSGNDGNDTTGEQQPPADDSPSFEMVAPPGIYSMPNGTTQALGILTYRDLEGGFWAVVKTAVPEEAATAEVVAVVSPVGEGLDVDLQTMNGEYVSVVGLLNEDPSIYMAGPVIEAQTVEVVRDMVVE